MNLCSIASGSSGNCIYVGSDDFMLDLEDEAGDYTGEER